MTNPNGIEIHTSDRATFKRCRRKFEWGSTLGENLIKIGPDHKAFFLGTGFHFALEDWWGYRRFAHPALAFAAYYDAQKPDDLPDEADQVLEMATGMLSYYVEDWIEDYKDREPWETLWVPDSEGVSRPQVEVEIAIDLTQLLFEALPTHHEAWSKGQELTDFQDWLEENFGPREVHYVITLDRAVIDKHERIFGLDYKTAASFDVLNLQTNPQAGSYDWAGNLFYSPTGYRFEGMIWEQFRKVVPAPPKWVNDGKKNEGFSTAVDQSTTYRLYRKALKARFGKMPNEERYSEMLGLLANAQSNEGDRFIRYDILRRNDKQREVEQEKIIAEVLEMLDPNLPMYPNPTKDCSWDCPFKAPCLAKDDGSDYEFILQEEYAQWSGYRDDWRARVKYPAALPS